MNFVFNMRFIAMFITAVCVLFLIKLRWPKKKSIYDIVYMRYGQETYEFQIWLNLTKTTMFRARATQYDCLFCHLVKHCRSDDNSLGEKLDIKSHLQALDLQGEHIIVNFYLIGC